jgi:hypothetical protein
MSNDFQPYYKHICVVCCYSCNGVSYWCCLWCFGISCRSAMLMNKWSLRTMCGEKLDCSWNRADCCPNLLLVWWPQTAVPWRITQPVACATVSAQWSLVFREPQCSGFQNFVSPISNHCFNFSWLASENQEERDHVADDPLCPPSPDTAQNTLSSWGASSPLYCQVTRNPAWRKYVPSKHNWI